MYHSQAGSTTVFDFAGEECDTDQVLDSADEEFSGWGKTMFLPDTRGKTWFEVTLIESDLGGFDQRDETWLVIKYITTFAGGNREVLSFLEEVLRALHCHFCQGF